MADFSTDDLFQGVIGGPLVLSTQNEDHIAPHSFKGPDGGSNVGPFGIVVDRHTSEIAQQFHPVFESGKTLQHPRHGAATYSHPAGHGGGSQGVLKVVGTCKGQGVGRCHGIFLIPFTNHDPPFLDKSAPCQETFPAEGKPVRWKIHCHFPDPVIIIV